MYRTSSKPTVSVSSHKPTFFASVKINFFKFLFKVTKMKYFYLKSVSATLASLPEHWHNCLDCNQRECICGDEYNDE